eukprot:m.348474 g.348474  ORF g.348474 m.348474 type:complete len:185 (-) comp37452_c0_seq1:219-773(-)
MECISEVQFAAPMLEDNIPPPDPPGNLCYDQDKDYNVIFSYEDDCSEVSEVLGAELWKAGYASVLPHTVGGSRNFRRRVWFGEMPDCAVAVVLLSPRYFESEECIEQLVTLCQENPAIIPIVVGPINIQGDFLGEGKVQRRDGNFIRHSIGSNLFPRGNACFDAGKREHIEFVLSLVNRAMNNS